MLAGVGVLVLVCGCAQERERREIRINKTNIGRKNESKRRHVSATGRRSSIPYSILRGCGCMLHAPERCTRFL